MSIIFDVEELLVLRSIRFGGQVPKKKSASFMSREQHDLERQLPLQREPGSNMVSKEITTAVISMALNVTNLSLQSAIGTSQTCYCIDRCR